MGDCQSTPVLGGMLQVPGVTWDKQLQLYSFFFAATQSLCSSPAQKILCVFLWCLKGL